MISKFNKFIYRRINILVEQSSLFCRSMTTIWTERHVGSKTIRDVVFRQILFTGIEALKIIVIIALAIGAVTIVEIITQLPRVGGQSYIGPVLVSVVVRELGPLLTAFIIIGRSGAAIATEIGNMMVSHEVQAIDSMGINPLRFIVMPRIVGVTVALVGLGLVFTVMALIGGYAFSRFMIEYPLVVYLADLGKSLKVIDILVGLIKCFSFGVIISTVSCYWGFSVKFSSHEVPQMMIKAAVTCIYMCFIANIIITALFYI